jgi:hypothetical protein
MKRCTTEFCSRGFAPPSQGAAKVTSSAGEQPPPGEPEARWTSDQPDERVTRPGESAALDMIDEIMRQAG